MASWAIPLAELDSYAHVAAIRAALNRPQPVRGGCPVCRRTTLMRPDLERGPGFWICDSCGTRLRRKGLGFVEVDDES